MPGPVLALVPRLPGRDEGVDVVAVPLAVGPDGPVPGPGATEIAQVLGVELGAEVARAKAKGEVGEVHPVPLYGDGPETLLIVGVGDGSARALRRAGAALARRTRGRRRLATTLADAGTDADGPDGTVGTVGASLRALAEGLVLGSYAFTRRREPKGPPALERADLVVTDTSPPPDTAPDSESATQQQLRRAKASAAAVWLARDLANTPSNEKDPAWLAERASELAADTGLDVRIRDERALAAEGFGGILAVGSGSARPPRLIELSYRPEQAAEGAGVPHVVLVGKGITFDSGGLSLKPNDGMVAMKTDMAAGGAVIAVMGALRELGIRARVTGLIPAAENLPSGTAQRPGDVITQYGGTTVEVFNTDAEGRLVLADALAYAVAELAPDLLVDMATLTGAASVGLGRRHGALYTGSDDLAEQLLAAGEASGDLLWRMPLVEDYRAGLDSDVADLSHISRDARHSGGSITAALFLREFVGTSTWAHLDIAGPARAEADEHEMSKGGTGFGVRLLLRWLEGLDPGPRDASNA